MQKRSLNLVLLDRVFVVFVIQDFAQLFTVGGSRDLCVGSVIYKRFFVVIAIITIEIKVRSGDGRSIVVVVIEELTHPS